MYVLLQKKDRLHLFMTNSTPVSFTFQWKAILTAQTSASNTLKLLQFHTVSINLPNLKQNTL